jgi:hypothetical protein
MAHFAQLDQNNQVTQVIVLSNAVVGDEYPASEPVGQSFIADTLKLDGVWKQTSYNNNFRKQYAGIGYTYSAVDDVFIAPQPYPSWSLADDFEWVAPVSMPDDGGRYQWNEESQEWVELAD